MKIKYLILLLLSLLMHNILFAQTKEKKVAPPSTAFVKPTKTMLIIPFDTKLYLSEVDRIVGPTSKKKPEELRNYFRNNLTAMLFAELQRNFISKSILQSATTQMENSQDDNLIFKSLSYKYEDPTKYENEKSPKPNKEKTKTLGMLNGQIVAQAESIEGKYYKALPEKALFNYLQPKYEADYILFISLFEFKNQLTDDNFDKNSNQPYRSLRVHYTLYDKTGVYVCGNFVEAKVPVSENKADMIVKTYFSQIVDHINTTILRYR